MANYKLELDRRVRKKDLANLPKTELKRILRRIESLPDEPRPHGSEKLTNQPGYRIRQGKYRILYVVDDKTRTVIIRAVSHRRKAYR
jgi:mRNA interferase RelE/StbE